VEVPRPTLAEMEAADPSEAARSEDILEMLEAHFDILARRDFGGTLLQMLLQDIVQNFDPNKDEDRILLDLLIHFEDALLQEQALPSDHLVIVAKSRDRKHKALSILSPSAFSLLTFQRRYSSVPRHSSAFSHQSMQP